MIGHKLADRYEIQHELGRGGMGSVYLAFDPVLERKVAIKWLAAPPTESLPKQRFLKEARLIAQMNHPNIVQIFDFYPDQDNPFFVMPVLQGETLRSRLEQGLLGIDEAFSLGIQVAQALEHSHAHGVIHRDIKPDNIFLTPTDHGFHVRVLDFGVALLMADSHAQGTGGVTGTLSYLSPEQLTGELVDERSDLYALGSVLYECLSGKPPYHGDLQAMFQKLAVSQPPAIQLLVPTLAKDHNSLLESGFAEQIMRCLQKDPAQRFASAKAFRRAFTTQQSGLGIGVDLPTTPSQPLDAAQTPNRDNVPTDPNAPLCIGRGPELSNLLAKLDIASTGYCHLSVLSGPTGIGKTHVATTLAWASQHDVKTLWGKCSTQANSFQCFGEIIQAFYEDSSHSPTSISRALGDLAPALLTLFPWLQLDAHAPASSRHFPHTTEQLQRLQTGHRGEVLELLAVAFQQMSEQQPFVLILESLHLSPASIEALNYMLHRLQHSPLMLIGTYNTDPPHQPLSEAALRHLLDSHHNNARCAHIELTPLSEEHQKMVLRALRPPHVNEYDQVWLTQGISFAQGNPGALLAWSQRPPNEEPTNPQITAVSNQQIEAIYQGQTAPYGAFLTDPPAGSNLDVATEEETLDDLPALPPSPRWEQEPPTSPEYQIKSVRSSIASTLSDSEFTAQTQLLQVAEQLGDLLLIQGKYMAARDAYQTAQRERQNLGTHISFAKEAYTLHKLAKITHSLGQYDETLRLCLEGLQLVDALAPMTAASLEALCGITCTAAGQLSDAEEWIRKGFSRIDGSVKTPSQETAVDDLGRNAAEALLYRAQGNLDVAQSRLTQAIEAYQDGLARCEQTRDAWEQSIALFNIGDALAHHGQHAEAQAYLQRALAEKAALGDRWGLAYTHHTTGFVFAEQERWEQAYAQVLIGLPLALEVGDPKLSASLYLLKARIQEQLSPGADTKETLQLAMHDAQRAFARSEWLQACAKLASLHLDGGDLQAAEALAREAESIALPLASPQRSAEVHRLWGRLHAQLAKPTHAVKRLEQALEAATPVESPFWQVDHLMSIASQLSQLDHFRLAQEIAQQAEQIATSSEFPQLRKALLFAQQQYPLTPGPNAAPPESESQDELVS